MISSVHNGFHGFPSNLERSNWQFPTIIDNYVDILTGAEFKVLWYILRHTYGWQKSFDKLSITQICNGIKKRDGTILDRGTGLSRKWVINALKLLEDKKFIIINRTIGKVSLISPRIANSNQCIKYPSADVVNTPVASVENTPTINKITIINTNTPSISPPKKYSSLKEITENDLVEISGKYKVPLGFVKLCLEKMTNWLEAKGKVYKNYKRGLMNWVLSEAQNKVDNRKGGFIDATEV